MAGRECYHCKQWVEEGEEHDCWTTTEAALLKDVSEDLRDAWERLRVQDHLATKWTKRLRVDSNEFSAGLEIPFLVKLLGNIKQGGWREQGRQEYELSFVSDLVELMNGVFVECNRRLAKHQNQKQWTLRRLVSRKR